MENIDISNEQRLEAEGEIKSQEEQLHFHPKYYKFCQAELQHCKYSFYYDENIVK